jgi:isopenicillin-N N-acyltransferase like protein
MSEVEIPSVEYRQGIYYLVLDAGTPHDRGYQHGAGLRFPIRNALREFRAWLRDVVGLADPEEMIHDFAASTPYLASVRDGAPDLIEEMEGIAKGAGVDPNQLFAYQSFDELFLFLWTSGALEADTTGHGTTAGVYGRADRPNYVGHNNDVPTYHEGLVTVLHIKYPASDSEEDGAREILQATFAGQIGQNGVNNRGLAVGTNALANLPAGDGLPVSFHVRKILESDSADDAIAYLKQSHFAQAMNYIIGDPGRVVSVETWRANALVLDIFPGTYAVHTNHSLGETTPKTFPVTTEMGGGSYGFSVERQELARDLLSRDTAGVTLEAFQQIFKTRPILVHPGRPTGRTLVNLVAVIPKQGSPILYLTPDSPSLYSHARFTF